MVNDINNQLNFDKKLIIKDAFEGKKNENVLNICILFFFTIIKILYKIIYIISYHIYIIL